ncbi:hypothetical protein BDQ17DRAFT_1261758, partial [Cyathus striatus]
GVNMCMDEISSDGRLCWIPKTDDIAGLCHEHVSYLKSMKMGLSIEMAQAVAEAIQAKHVHVAQEILVIALGRNDQVDYDAKPILILIMCKQGNFLDAALIIEKVRQAYRMLPCREAQHGPILSISSDGEPKHHPALYLHCMVRKLVPSDSLFQHLSFLTGFNLWMGSHFETQDFNYKHLLKRDIFCFKLSSKSNLKPLGIAKHICFF